MREARYEDLSDVIKINKEVLPENYPAFYFELHLKNFGRAFLVAEINGKVVGYIMCRVEYDTLYTNPNRVGKRGHIISIAVLPYAQGKGIGTELMTRALESMKKYYGAEEYYLEVRVSNEVALRLYKKLGFSVVKVLPGYYLDGEDAYLMARPA
ncbi:ribosomal protein S18-alanine N-acetyltransferase [Infirmifilum lucidum]|uniref:Ribosomal protein S18-alanine N-acetyltransferase n=1 Tax=Infirmifilum lucidum TaxID=2776706 RepID=A0A7L9FJ24_9CREN|nr:ribosomal protein S18-alanine N-acetyltransferase [Infirmifilum lucidum]QOJ79780.1 ribosomal protein S18-alanine N-acetyltransferase [Infirmifilum lucidum]